MTQDHYILLIQKQLSGEITPEEQKLLNTWRSASVDNRQVEKSVRKAWDLSSRFSKEPELDIEEDFRRIESRILQDKKTSEAPVRRLLNRRWLLRIAAVFLLVAVGPYLLKKYLQPAIKYQVVTTNDNPSENPVALLDGSKVWLNANTEFTYFTTSVSKERRVKIRGEAFFEVTEDSRKPFVVETPAGEVTVLGTSFSVMDRDGDIEVKVVTGTVKLSPKNSKQHLVLQKNEKGVYRQSENRLVKTRLANFNELAWQTKKLVFDNTPLKDVAAELGQFYTITIEIKNEELASCPITATFENKKIDAVIQTLQVLLGAQAEKTAKGGYLLKGGQCE